MKHNFTLLTLLMRAPLAVLQGAGASKPFNNGNRHEPIE